MHAVRCAKTKLRVLLFQFAVLMWLLTYVGALFNGLTLLILGELTLLLLASIFYPQQ